MRFATFTPCSPRLMTFYNINIHRCVLFYLLNHCYHLIYGETVTFEQSIWKTWIAVLVQKRSSQADWMLKRPTTINVLAWHRSTHILPFHVNIIVWIQLESCHRFWLLACFCGWWFWLFPIIAVSPRFQKESKLTRDDEEEKRPTTMWWHDGIHTPPLHTINVWCIHLLLMIQWVSCLAPGFGCFAVFQ